MRDLASLLSSRTLSCKLYSRMGVLQSSFSWISRTWAAPIEGLCFSSTYIASLVDGNADEASLDKASAHWFSSLATWVIFYDGIRWRSSFDRLRYAIIRSLCVLNSPSTCLATSWLSTNMSITFTSSSIANLIPASNASYFVTLFVTGNDNLRACWILKPSGLTKIIPAPQKWRWMIHQQRASKISWVQLVLLVEVLRIDIPQRNQIALELWLQCEECMLWRIGLTQWSMLQASPTCLVYGEFFLGADWWQLGFPDLGSSIVAFCLLLPGKKTNFSTWGYLVSASLSEWLT